MVVREQETLGRMAGAWAKPKRHDMSSTRLSNAERHSLLAVSVGVQSYARALQAGRSSLRDINRPTPMTRGVTRYRQSRTASQ